jgi:hypothetical protein
VPWWLCAALALMALPAAAQQNCGVSVNIFPVGRDTIQGQFGPIPRCIYDVHLKNTRNDVARVTCTPDSPSVIWFNQAGPPTWTAGNSVPHFWFIPYGGVYPTTNDTVIGKLWVSGPAPQSLTITFTNPNGTVICTQKAIGQCGQQGGATNPFQGCLTNSINISTGYDPVSGTVLPPSFPPYTDIKDGNWIVISDPLSTTNEPRPSSTISNSCWGTPPLPGSQWIAVYNSPSNDTNGVYVFQRCFCVEGRTRGVIDLWAYADDVIDSIVFNGQRLTNRTPSLTNTWFSDPPREYRDTVTIQSGTNCITVYVRNTHNVCFGLDIAGSIMQLPNLSPAVLADTCCNRKGWIMGQKYHDLNCNGKVDQGEPVLSGWTITATSGTQTYSATTGSDGWYSIQVPAGTYTLTEQPKPGFSQSAGGPYIVTIAAGQVKQYDFLNCTAPPPCDTIGKVRLDSGCCQFTIPIFPVSGGGVPGITSINWSLSGGTMESITIVSCNASFPNPYGQSSGTITFSPACTANPVNLMMEVNPTTASGVVTLVLTINHGTVRVCRDTLQLRCARAPLTRCDSLAVSPFVWTGLNLSGRTFTIFNQKQPASPIKEVHIQLVPDPNPSNSTFKWNGGGLQVDNSSRSWGIANSGTPYYSRISMQCPGMPSAPQGVAASSTVKFNLGVDYTLNWTGSVVLTVIHCDGDTCTLTYPDWCAKYPPRACAQPVPWPPKPPIGPIRPVIHTAWLMEVQIDTLLIPGTRELHACAATVVPITRDREWTVVGLSVDDGLTPDERESGRYLSWSGEVGALNYGWGRVALSGCKYPDDSLLLPPLKQPWILRATLASSEPTADTPRVAVTFYDQDGNPIVADTAKAAIRVTSVPVEITAPSGGNSSGILQVVPNPAADEVRVEYVLARPSEVTVELCDVLGKCRVAAHLGWMPAGVNSFGISTAELPVGSYTIRLRTSDGVLTAPLRVVR